MATTPSQTSLFTGGCRCGAVKYASSSPPSDITICYCRACQQVSGSGFLPFLAVPTKSFQIVERASLKTIELSSVAKRTFCGDCGSPITMVYEFAADSTSITVGSIDDGSWKVERPKIKKHIFIKEKAFWTQIPDDGVERSETSSVAHLIKPHPPAKG